MKLVFTSLLTSLLFVTASLSFAGSQTVNAQGFGLGDYEEEACKEAQGTAEYMLEENCQKLAGTAEYCLKDIFHNPCHCDFDPIYESWQCGVNSTATCEY